MPPKTREHPSASDTAHGQSGTKADGGDRQQILHNPPQTPRKARTGSQWLRQLSTEEKNL